MFAPEIALPATVSPAGGRELQVLLFWLCQRNRWNRSHRVTHSRGAMILPFPPRSQRPRAIFRRRPDEALR
jgi:hypothetical protein